MRTLTISAVVVAALLFCALSAAQSASVPVVKEIGIQGLERISEQLVRSQLEVQAGQSYNPNAVARDIRRLYGLGHFDAIKVDAAASGDGVKLTYIFIEKRIIDEIRIMGNSKIKAGKIRGVLSWKEGDSFAADAYDEERDAILKLYEEKGCANTSVDIQVEKVGPSRVRLVYAITEGKKARIRNIEFAGNNALTDRKLRKAMKTHRAFWFLGGKYNEDQFEEDLKKIVDEYGNVGHLEAEVASTNVEYSPNGKKMDISINVAEGAQYTVESLEPAQNTVYDDDEVMDIVKVHAGDVHNKGQVEDDANLIARGYQGSGYVNADAAPQVTLDREKKTTHVVHNVQEGDLKYVKEIEVTGNSVTKDDVVRREMMLVPGERFDGSVMQMSQRRLENTQYFDEVRMTLHDDEENDLFTNMLVDVDEGKTGNFNFGAGYSTEEKASGFIELKLNNFDISNWPKFSGGGQVFSTRLQIGDIRDKYNMSFTDPEFLGYPVAFGFDVYNESYRYTDESDYTEEMVGGQLRLGKTLSPFVTARTSFRYTDYDYTDTAWKWLYTCEWRRELEPSTTVANSWGIERNTLDLTRDPTSGSKHELVGTVAGFGGDNNFLKFEHDSTWYRPFGEERQWVLSFRTREGWVDEYGSSDFVPLGDRFFAGGTSTVRGYDTHDIGPKVRKYWLPWSEKDAIGGKLRLINNLEMKYQVSKVFRLYGFVDAGGVWKEPGDLDLGDVKYSTGLGFGVDVPRMGPIRVYYGVPLNPDDDQGNGRLHLVTGFRF